jgi:non-specific serine/threonine protein kinase
VLAPLLLALAWQAGPALPVARTEVAGAAYAGGVAVVGGYLADGRSTGRVDLYRPGRGWSRLPTLPVRVNHASAATSRGRLYVVGGYGAERSAFVLEGRHWRRLPRLPEPRAAATAVALRGSIYVFGGVGAGGLAKDGLVLTRGRWRRVPGPTPRQHVSGTALGKTIYVVGGRTAGYDTNLDIAESWTPGQGAWRRLPPLPSPRGGTGLAAAGGMIVSVGGEEPAGTIASVYAFRPGEASWSRLPDLPTPRHGLAVVALGRTVYAIAGGPEPGLHVSDANERLTLP